MTNTELETNLTNLLLIPIVLASQPRVKWLDKLRTSDQIEYWRLYSRRFYWTAQCWVSRSTFQDDPLRPLLKAGRISRNEYNIIWSSEMMYERLWTLCQQAEPFVREAFNQAKVEYPFTNAVSLFAQAVSEMVDSNFAQCLKPYSEHSGTKREKALRLQIKAYEGKSLTKVQKKLVEAECQGIPLTDLVLKIARRAAKEEVILKYALEDYKTACVRVLKCCATEVHNKGCHAWIDGHLAKGAKSSAYSLPDS